MKTDCQACRLWLIGRVMEFTRVITAVFLLASATGFSQEQIDVTAVVGRDACSKCHPSELSAWRVSKHGKNAWDLLDHPKAPDFAKKLGISAADIKSEKSVCTKCHGTHQKTAGKLTISKGNSCESCHGGAGGDGGWLTVHSDYGQGTTGTLVALLAQRESEATDHLVSRKAATRKAGMNRAEDTLALATNCLQCHIVPDEKLIAAGHPSSTKFEFVEWVQGEVRHNFLLDSKSNAEVPSLWMASGAGRTAKGRKQLMFVSGQLADLVLSLRIRAGVTSAKRGTLGDLVNDRIDDALDELEDAKIDDLAAVFDIMKKSKIKKSTLKRTTSADEKLYGGAADAVQAVADAFIAKYKNAAGLPASVKPPRKAKGKAFKN
ncbi:MAG: hypothetical protein CMJ75_03745 [Planctomycetaceae bacterium]|nr:hypothetical protein [Planctomycetaceae bacterium]